MTNLTKALLPAVMAVLGITVADAALFTVDGLQYTTLSDSTVSVKQHLEGTDVKIPAKVTDPDDNTEYAVVQVERRAFYQANIKTLSVAGSVKHIDTYAFWQAKVETVTIEDGVETIGYGAFKACPNLTSVKLPSTLKELGTVYYLTGGDGCVFGECGALKDIEVPGSVKTIPDQTFMGCISLATVKLNEGTDSIGERAFELCTSLRSLEIPSSVVKLGRAVFNKSGLENPVVPGQIKIIPNSAYLWCQNMQSFKIEEGVEEVGKSSFADCRGFTRIDVPNSVEWIRSDAFQGNPFVKEIYIGSGIRRMGHASLAVWAPDQATNTPQWVLEEIHIASPVPPVHEQNDDHFDIVADDFFFGGKEFTDELRAKFYSEVKLYVPESAIEEYKKADIWKEFTNILPEEEEQGGVDGITMDGGIRIENGIVYADGKIEVYTLAGNLSASSEGMLNLDMLGKGMYIVRAGDKTIKTVVK